MRNDTFNGDGFKLTHIECFAKGDLKGYMTAMLHMDNSDRQHELLYRINKDENGRGHEIVSVDYGYNNPMIEEKWDDIERACYVACKTL